MCETLPGISRNQMRETETYAHLISCFLTDGGSISFLRQKARAQKARKMGLSELSASFRYMNFAFLKSRNYVKIQVQNEIFPRGKKSGLMHVVAEGGGGKRRPFCRRMVVKAGNAHTDKMQESQGNATESVGLMLDYRLDRSAVFLFVMEKEHLRRDALSLKIGSAAQDKRILHHSIDLVITSPPFALQRQKEYGNQAQNVEDNIVLLTYV